MASDKAAVCAVVHIWTRSVARDGHALRARNDPTFAQALLDEDLP